MAIAISAVGVALASYQGQVEARQTWVNPTHEGEPPRLSHLTFPSLDKDLYVFEGAEGDNLLFGPVHVKGSVEPGERGNVIIAAHRDTHFRILKDVKQGDEIRIERAGRNYRYRVVGLNIV